MSKMRRALLVQLKRQRLVRKNQLHRQNLEHNQARRNQVRYSKAKPSLVNRNPVNRSLDKNVQRNLLRVNLLHNAASPARVLRVRLLLPTNARQHDLV